MNKTYLGDAVYAEINQGGVVLTVENGIDITETIFLETEVIATLIQYIIDQRLIQAKKKARDKYDY